MIENHRKIELKYFVIKMKQEINIDYLCSQLMNKIPLGSSGYVVTNFKDIAQIFLDSFIMNDGKNVGDKR